MILSKEKILELVEKDKLIDGLDEKSVGGAGYDLRIGRVYRIRNRSFLGVSDRTLPEIDEIKEEKVVLKPDEYVLVETIEKVNMPAGVAARILPRSTVFRCGCSLITALVDPGYKGTLTMGLRNLSSCDFTVERGARIGQIVFEEVCGKTELYNGKYQGGKVV